MILDKLEEGQVQHRKPGTRNQTPPFLTRLRNIHNFCRCICVCPPKSLQRISAFVDKSSHHRTHIRNHPFWQASSPHIQHPLDLTTPININHNFTLNHLLRVQRTHCISVLHVHHNIRLHLRHLMAKHLDILHQRLETPL